MRTTLIWVSLFIVLTGPVVPSTAQSRNIGAALTDTVAENPNPAGWSDDAVTIGIFTAPAALGLMFISALVSEWNSGIAGIPASALILAAPPLIYAGGRSAALPPEYGRQRAMLGWTLWVLAVIPTSFALYEFTTDWGATIPLTIASGVLGSASILAMSSYSFSRAQSAVNRSGGIDSGWNFRLAPLPGGALAMISYRF